MAKLAACLAHLMDHWRVNGLERQQSADAEAEEEIELGGHCTLENFITKKRAQLPRLNTVWLGNGDVHLDLVD